jgi:hypothetical protein
MPSLSTPAEDEPLLVTVREAQRLLNVSNTCFYEQVLCDLETFKVGKTRRITLKSVKSYIARQLAESAGHRKRGRPPGSKNRPKSPAMPQPEIGA